MAMINQPVHLAGSVLDRARHACAFFHNRDEEYQVLLPFIKEGFERGDKAFHIVDPNHRSDHLRRLQASGIDIATAEAKNQLEVRRWEDAYLQDGHFDQNRMLSLIQEVLTNGKAQGFPLTRLVANMEWALEDRPGVSDIVEYETRLNYVLPKYDDAVV
jgi:MEDS: MEthanogen/methylotroph, DcmR Sensory domain